MNIEELKYPVKIDAFRINSSFSEGNFRIVRFMELDNIHYVYMKQKLPSRYYSMISGDELEMKKLYGYIIAYTLDVIKEEDFEAMYPDLKI